MRRLRRCLFLLAAMLAFAPSARAAEPVDLLLVLAADVSRSVDADKFKLQREGYAAAIANKRVLDVIRSGRHGRIGVLFLEWSGFGNQKVVIDWTLIDGPKAAQAFGDRLLELPRSFADRTSISGGIDFAVAQLARAPFTAERQTIDVSGDGTNNAGRDITAARDEALALGYHHQRPGDPERAPAALESRTHQSARRPGQLLPQQRGRRARRLRAGGEGLQFVRPGDHQENDRRNRRCEPATPGLSAV